MVSDNNSELPFFPQYDTQLLHEGKLRVTWFEANFSQSHYNVQNSTRGSNACTLIAVLMAAKCHQYNVQINDPEIHLNIRIIHLFAASMLEGNKIHDELKQQNLLKHVNLNVPEALTYSGKQTKNMIEWKSEIYMEPLSTSLLSNLKKNWREWIKMYPETDMCDLYVMLVADSRTVLFIVQSTTETVTLVDSHQHSAEKGAFIATAKLSKLKFLCQWYTEVLSKYYNCIPDLYELSFLYFNCT